MSCIVIAHTSLSHQVTKLLLVSLPSDQVIFVHLPALTCGGTTYSTRAINTTKYGFFGYHPRDVHQSYNSPLTTELSSDWVIISESAKWPSYLCSPSHTHLQLPVVVLLSQQGPSILPSMDALDAVPDAHLSYDCPSQPYVHNNR